jgi:lipoprotein NlpI
MRRQLSNVFALMVLVGAVGLAWGDTAEDNLRRARQAWDQGKRDEALELVAKAMAQAPNDSAPVVLRVQFLDALGKHKEALADLAKLLSAKPNEAELYDLRGSVHFKAGMIKESLADFDRFLALKPNEFPGHWRRGITCYYAGAFDEGKKQFEGYEKVDTNDVENAVWRYLCMARSVGVAKAQADILKIGNDRRIPMMKVYELFSGKAKPEDVMTAAKSGDPSAAELRQRLFYTHLYLGLWHEAQGDKKLALEHLKKAAEDYRISHYMGDVARVHVQVLKSGSEK